MAKEPTLQYRDANLNDFPRPIHHDPDITHISIGDLHGNVMKLIYFLIEEGVMQLKDNQHYAELKTIYDKNLDELSQKDINRFEIILTQAIFNKQYVLTLIGDELADRGQNDYFTLLVIKRLFEEKIEVEILLSNHSVEFIRDYERARFTGQYQLSSDQGRSLKNMVELIKKGWVNENQIREIIKNCYAPLVKGISYTVSDNGTVTLFTHAPVGLETVEALAIHYNIQYSDISQRALINTIDAINHKISKQFGKNLAITIEGQWVRNQFKIPVINSLYRLVWNRALRDELKTEPTGHFKIYFVHGHIGPNAIKKNGEIPLRMFENMDNYFGKNALDESTTYDAIDHFTRHASDTTAKQLDAGFFDRLDSLQRYQSVSTYSKIQLFLVGKNDRRQSSLRCATHIKAANADFNPLYKLNQRRHSYQRSKIMGGLFIIIGLVIAFDPQDTAPSMFSRGLTLLGIGIAMVGVKMAVSARNSLQESRAILSKSLPDLNDSGKQILVDNHLKMRDINSIRARPNNPISRGAIFKVEQEEKKEAFDFKLAELIYK